MQRETRAHPRAGSNTAKRTGAALVAMVIACTAIAPGVSGASARYAGMPDPVGYEQPTQETLDAESTETSVFLRGEHRLRRFDVSGSVTRSRMVDFGTGKAFAGGIQVREFNDRPYLQIPGGSFAGWWVSAMAASPSSSRTLAQPATVRLAAGTHLGLRFYKDTRVKTRLAVQLNAESDFGTSRRAVFGGRAYYKITSGPLSGRWVSASGATMVSAEQQSGNNTDGAEQPLATWKALALVYRETDVTFRRANGSSYRLQARMTDSMRDLIVSTLGRARSSVDGWSSGLAEMDLDVVNVPHPITSLTEFGSGYWVGPGAVASDIDTYAPRGKYDSVFVVWQSHDDAGVHVPVGGWGLTLPPGSWANGAGYSSVIAPLAEWWWTGSDVPQEVFVHEWMHQVVFWHENNDRMRLDLHSGAAYGYEATGGTWKGWLSDVMRGRVWDGDSYLGVKPELWAVGTPRNF